MCPSRLFPRQNKIHELFQFPILFSHSFSSLSHKWSAIDCCAWVPQNHIYVCINQREFSPTQVLLVVGVAHIVLKQGTKERCIWLVGVQLRRQLKPRNCAAQSLSRWSEEVPWPWDGGLRSSHDPSSIWPQLVYLCSAVQLPIRTDGAGFPGASAGLLGNEGNETTLESLVKDQGKSKVQWCEAK